MRFCLRQYYTSKTRAPRWRPAFGLSRALTRDRHLSRPLVLTPASAPRARRCHVAAGHCWRNDGPHRWPATSNSNLEKHSNGTETASHCDGTSAVSNQPLECLDVALTSCRGCGHGRGGRSEGRAECRTSDSSTADIHVAQNSKQQT